MSNTASLRDDLFPARDTATALDLAPAKTGAVEMGRDAATLWEAEVRRGSSQDVYDVLMAHVDQLRGAAE